MSTIVRQFMALLKTIIFVPKS